MSVAEKLVQRARAAGLPPGVADALEHGLKLDLDAFLATVPDAPPSDPHEESELLLGFLALYRPHVRLVLTALSKLIDAAIASLDDLIDDALYHDVKRRKALHHLEEAIASFTRMATAAAAVLARRPPSGWGDLGEGLDVDEDSLDEEGRPYARGLLALLVALDRASGELHRFVPWAWLARRDLLKSEANALVRIHELAPLPSGPGPARVPGAWKGRMRIADDFDESLPKEIEDSFYESDPERPR